jgi:hypothetical protein
MYIAIYYYLHICDVGTAIYMYTSVSIDWMYVCFLYDDSVAYHHQTYCQCGTTYTWLVYKVKKYRAGIEHNTLPYLLDQ